MASPLQNSIEFFREFGLFDVVLPFLLVFTIIFAILEKTRILGTVKIKGDEVPNKNLNSMVSFVVALLTVATANVVRTINESLPNVVLLTVDKDIKEGSKIFKRSRSQISRGYVFECAFDFKPVHF